MIIPQKFNNSYELPHYLLAMRSIQHAIDLVPKEALLNLTVYRMPPQHRVDMQI